ncbi:MAG: tryptophan--tRNA ligase [Planctomycetota bacterium]
MQTILSGIQATGLPHLGNYFGAIRPHVALQDEVGTKLYFIADFHALTTCRDPEALRASVREIAATYLALGLDPERAALFRQTDVPEVTEIAWLLSCVTGMGLLERAHSYKDKVAKGQKPNVGLFFYPVLMAADILAYDATLVPVGRDQAQHLEMTQDMAASFNHLFGEVFQRPEARMPGEELFAKVPGVDGEKMSKSYGNDIWIFAEGKALKKAVNRIVTDSREPSESKDPDSVLLMSFLGLFLEREELDTWRERLRAGGADAPGYGHLKARLIEAMDAEFAPARERRRQLLDDPAELDRALLRGAETARARAQATVDRARRATGLR